MKSRGGHKLNRMSSTGQIHAQEALPCSKRLNVAQSPGVAANIGEIFVPRRLSQVNHRLYRDSRTYTCSVSVDSNLADATTVDVYALADTWYLKVR